MQLATAAIDSSNPPSGSVSVAEQEVVKFGGVEYKMGPRICLCPFWALSFKQMREKLQGANVTIGKG